MRTIKARLAGMRKEQEFVIYPFNPAYDSGTIKIQSDKAIGEFDRKTGKGVLNWRGSNSKYGVHLSPTLGAEAYQFPEWLVAACQEHQLQPGDYIGGALWVGSGKEDASHAST